MVTEKVNSSLIYILPGDEDDVVPSVVRLSVKS